MLEKVRNKQGIGFNINDLCWNLDIKLESEILPSSSTYKDGVEQKIITMNLLLKPLGGIKQKYKMENDN